MTILGIFLSLALFMLLASRGMNVVIVAPLMAILAGQAFANSPVAAVHALAYPIGGQFHVPHGLSNALVLPHVLRFNAAAAGQQPASPDIRRCRGYLPPGLVTGITS
jgi:hypothetical protein